MTADTFELLRQASQGTAAPLPADLARALLTADPDQVARILGLDRASRTRRRNAALQRAAALLAADGCGAWVAAERLARAVRRFERALWPALMGTDGTGLPLSDLERSLFEAFASGAAPIASARRLYELLRID